MVHTNSFRLTVVAANIELSVGAYLPIPGSLGFRKVLIGCIVSGDTPALESAVSSSSTSANFSVGWGPFSVSGSHSSSKSESKTKMESTATGCK